MTEPVDLTQPTGPPLSTAQLAYAVGFSTQFVRLEIQAGALRAVKCGRGARAVYRIHWREAQRYAVQLGILTTSQTLV